MKAHGIRMWFFMMLGFVASSAAQHNSLRHYLVGTALITGVILLIDLILWLTERRPR